ncbi:GerMN domain-containing protein [Anaerosolibacter sp.]|uniref:GerMN domain-containing protein n=1 Tax=Anaerosolibacter sp. TaxID=1872527 RepID=UPI0026087159|nr:GerMN domain-containing protein [Anaerosolibacter sp.]
MKTLYRLLLLLFVMMIMGVGIYNYSKDNDIGQNQPPIPPVPDQTKYRLKLYFGSPDNNRLISEERVIISDELQEEKLIIEELIKGPRNKTLKASIPIETKLLSIKTIDNICYVNLSKSFLNSYRWDLMNEAITIWSVVNSLTEIERVQAVQFLIEGDRVGAIEKYYSLKEPFYRNEELFRKEVITPFDTFNVFLDYLRTGSYDNAYKMLSKTSTDKVDFLKFKLNMGTYIRELRDYEIARYQTQKYSNKVILLITYEKKPTAIGNLENEFMESWQMIYENGEWKIVMPI